MAKHGKHDAMVTGHKQRAGHKFDIIQFGERYQVVDLTDNEPMGWMDKTRKDAEGHMKDVEAEAMRAAMFPEAITY